MCVIGVGKSCSGSVRKRFQLTSCSLDYQKPDLPIRAEQTAIGAELISLHGQVVGHISLDTGRADMQLDFDDILTTERT